MLSSNWELEHVQYPFIFIFILNQAASFNELPITELCVENKRAHGFEPWKWKL